MSSLYKDPQLWCSSQSNAVLGALAVRMPVLCFSKDDLQELFLYLIPWLKEAFMRKIKNSFPLTKVLVSIRILSAFISMLVQWTS